MFDTHCHLNFKSFDSIVDRVISDANRVGVDQILIPGTDIESSIKAIEIANKFDGVYAAVGIHPHHVFEMKIKNGEWRMENEINKLKQLLTNPKVVAIGEVGIDRHIYKKTKYDNYDITNEFIEAQKLLLKEQIKLAIYFDKSLILHNREAKADVTLVLDEVWDIKLEFKTVFHCCEPDLELLEYVKKHKMFIGIDGDIFYKKDKQEFIKNLPLELLVLETDSPFLSPTRQNFNEPKNIFLIAEFIAKLKNISQETIAQITTQNAQKLFNLD